MTVELQAVLYTRKVLHMMPLEEPEEEAAASMVLSTADPEALLLVAQMAVPTVCTVLVDQLVVEA